MKKFVMIFLLSFLVLNIANARNLEFQDMFTMNRVSNATVSPDGNWIAYVISKYDVESNSGNKDIFLVSMDGKTTQRLTTNSKNDFSPRWNPNGKQLSFISTRNGSAQIYQISLSGGEAVQLTNVPTGVDDFVWSPDGKYLVIATQLLPDAKSPAESVKMEEDAQKAGGSGREIDRLMYRHCV